MERLEPNRDDGWSGREQSAVADLVSVTADSGDVDRAFRGSGSRTLALGAGLIVSTPSDPLASSKRG
jgi:hypothetical protein